MLPRARCFHLPSLYLQHCHHNRLLATTSLRHTQGSTTSPDSFGSLAAKHKQKHWRDEEHVTLARKPSQYSKDLSSPHQASLKHNSYSTELAKNGMLEKWQGFRNAQDQETQETLGSWGDGQQDDAEDDYHLYMSRSPRPHRQNRPTNETLQRQRSCQNVTKPGSDSFGGVELPWESSGREVFGYLTPKKAVMEEGDEGDLREEHYQEAKGAKRHRPQFYGARMRDLCKERKLAEAIKILEEEMPAVGAKPNSFCYQVLINACGRAGYTKKAFQLYNQMKKRSIKVEPVAYTGLFNACAHSPWPSTDGLTRATHLRMLLKEKGIQVNQTTSHAMIKAFGRCGDMSTALVVVDEMIQEGLLVTTETVNFLLQGCITNKEAGFWYAVKVWRKMRQMKLKPDIYSYNLLMCVIKGCGTGGPDLTSSLLLNEINSDKPRIEASQKKKQLSKPENSEKKELPHPETLVTKEVHLDNQNSSIDVSLFTNEERDAGVQRLENSAGECVLPDILGKKFTAGNVVGLGALDKPQDRLALLGGPTGILRQMMKDRVKPDLKTFTQLLDSLPPDTLAEQALLESMKNVGQEPDTQFFNMLIRKRNFRHDTQAAQDVLSLMQHHHLIPDLITYGCLALGCSNIRSATQLLKDMDASQFRPNLEIMTMLTKNSLVKQDYAFTVAIMREMQQRGIIPSNRLFNVLEKARTQARETLLLKQDSSVRDQDRRKKSAETFLSAYKVWLMASQVQLPEHPWSQYR